MKHVAMLIPTIDQTGGAERQVLLLTRALAARGWRVTLLTLSGSPEVRREELAAAGVASFSLQMRKAWVDPRGWRRYCSWAAHNRPDIVHSHLPHATWFARCVRPLAPVPVLVDTIHTSRTAGKRLGYRLTNWLPDAVTCVSPSVAQAALRAGLVVEKRLSILPNGVPLPPQNRLPRRRVSPFLWIAVGRLAAVKDYPTLLKAFAALPGLPRLAIAGSGPEEAALRALAAQLGVEGRIHFAGFQAEIDPLLAQADAFVLSSLWEGLPVSVLEAQAAGLPVVATRAAGTADAMLENESGLLVPVGDHAALAAAMAAVAAMPYEARQRMGDRGREFVERHFSLDAVAGRWEALYGRLLEASPRPARWARRSTGA